MPFGRPPHHLDREVHANADRRSDGCQQIPLRTTDLDDSLPRGNEKSMNFCEAPVIIRAPSFPSVETIGQFVPMRLPCSPVRLAIHCCAARVAPDSVDTGLIVEFRSPWRKSGASGWHHGVDGPCMSATPCDCLLFTTSSQANRAFAESSGERLQLERSGSLEALPVPSPGPSPPCPIPDRHQLVVASRMTWGRVMDRMFYLSRYSRRTFVRRHPRFGSP